MVTAHIRKETEMAKSERADKLATGREILEMTAEQGDVHKMFIGDVKGHKESAHVAISSEPSEENELETLTVYMIPDLGLFADQHQNTLDKDKKLNGPQAAIKVLNKFYKQAEMELAAVTVD